MKYCCKNQFDLLWSNVYDSLYVNLFDRYGMVLLIDHLGIITTTFQDPSGSISMISEAQVHPKTGDLWLGSHSNPFVGIVPAEKITKSSADKYKS